MSVKTVAVREKQRAARPSGKSVLPKESFMKLIRGAAPANHAYVALLGIAPSPTSKLVEQIETGFPFSSLENFQQALGVSLPQTAELLGIPQRTLVRRKEQGSLAAGESEQLLRFARLLGGAIELFEGDEAAARHWLQTPKRALGDISPLAMARTELGAREVENLLGRLEHGVFS